MGPLDRSHNRDSTFAHIHAINGNPVFLQNFEHYFIRRFTPRLEPGADDKNHLSSIPVAFCQLLGSMKDGIVEDMVDLWRRLGMRLVRIDGDIVNPRTASQGTIENRRLGG